LWSMSKRMVLAPLPAGRGATGKIIAGIAIIAISFGIGAFFSAGIALGGFMGIGTVATATSAIGLSLVFSGVAELLTPTPKMPNVKGGGLGGGSSATSGRSQEEQLNSFAFDKSNANTVQGDVVPVLYGERIIGALPVLSFGLELQNFL